MNCVSYTRVVSDTYTKVNASGGPDCGIPLKQAKMEINEQNEIIEAFAKNKGLIITKRYSDRKESSDAEEAFVNLREDIVNRRVDCLIVHSIYFCGPSLSAAKDLLRGVMYPAGIPFIVIEDDFCSDGKSYEEVSQYFKDKLNEFRSMMASRISCSWFPHKRYLKYGYIWEPDGSYKIDREAADVVKLIFKLTLDGMLPREIISYMEEHNIEGENHYRRRKTGQELKRNYSWNISLVNHILSDTSYAGYFDKAVGKETMITKCPQIITEEQFLNVRKIVEERTIGKSNIRVNTNPFRRKIYDKESDTPLVIYSSKNGPIYRYRNPAPINDYTRRAITYKEVEDAFKNMLIDQSEKARKADELLKSSSWEEDFKSKNRKLFKEFNDSFHELSMLNASCEENDIQRFKEANIKFEEFYKAVSFLKAAVSNKNKWLQTFLNVKSDKVTYELVQKYVERINIIRFEEVEIIPKYVDWFKELPSEWFE